MIDSYFQKYHFLKLLIFRKIEKSKPDEETLITSLKVMHKMQKIYQKMKKRQKRSNYKTNDYFIEDWFY